MVGGIHIKKRKFLPGCVILLFLTVVGCSAVVQAKDREIRGQILYYNFKDPKSAIVEDVSGRGNDGLIRNYRDDGVRVTSEVINAVQVNALDLPGGTTGAYLELPSDILEGETEITVSTWVNLRSATPYQRIWDFGNNQSSYLYLLSNGNNRGFKGYATAITIKGWTQENGVEKGSDFPRNTWVFTTVTIKDNRITLYEDGAVIGEAETQAGLSDLGATRYNYFGKGQFTDEHLNGKLAEIAIYNYAMDETQVKALFENGLEDQAVQPETCKDADRLLYSYRQNYEVDTKGAAPLSGWENPAGLLRGRAVGEWLTSLAQRYQGNPDEALEEKASYMAGELRSLQLLSEEMGWGKGYLGADSPGQLTLLENGGSYPDTGAPYAVFGSLLNGLLDTYDTFDSLEALNTAESLGKWITERSSSYTQEQKKAILSQDVSGDTQALGGALARLARIKKDDSFLKSAWNFVHMEWYTAMKEGRDRMNLLSVQAAVSQAETLLEISHTDPAAAEAVKGAENFWNMAAEKYSSAAGMTGVDGRFRNEEQKIENTVLEREKNKRICRSMLELTWKLHQIQPDNPEYMEYYENLLCNQLLEDGECGDVDAMRVFEVNDDTVTVNLYRTGEKTLSKQGLKMIMKADAYSEEALLKVVNLKEKSGTTMQIRFRVPSWCSENMQILVNGEEAKTVKEQGFLILSDIAGGDEIRLHLPFSCYLKAGNRDNLAAVMYGPFVMVSETDVFKDTLILTKKVTDMAERMNSRMPALTINGIKFIPYAASAYSDRKIYYQICYTENPAVKWYEVRIEEESVSGGSIRADKELVFENEQVILYINPKEGYVLQSLTVNAKEVKAGEDGSYQIPKVTDDLTVSASFAEKNPLTVKSGSLEQNAELSAHYTASWENLEGVKDAGFHPASSNEGMGKGWGNWQQPAGASSWIAYHWIEPVTIGACEIYWYDDADDTGAPSDFQVEYLDEKGEWCRAVMKTEAGMLLKKDQYNGFSLETVTTKGLRLVMTVAEDKRAIGIYRWKVSEHDTK